MQQLFQWFKDYLNIDMIIVLLVIFSGFFQEKYFQGFRLSKNDRHDASLKTLVLSAVISITYILLFYNFNRRVNIKNNLPVDPIPWAKYFISYFTATSLYDLIIAPIRRYIQRKTGEDAEPESKP
jgi:hypothetical protein